MSRYLGTYVVKLNTAVIVAVVYRRLRIIYFKSFVIIVDNHDLIIVFSWVQERFTFLKNWYKQWGGKQTIYNSYIVYLHVLHCGLCQSISHNDRVLLVAYYILHLGQ